MPKYYDYKCKVCGTVIQDSPNASPPVCLDGHGLMSRKFTPLGISMKGGHAERDRRKRWQAERDHDEKEQSDNQQQIHKDIEGWKRNYVAGELHHKGDHNPDEPNTRAFKEAGHVSRKESTIEHEFKE